MNNGSRGEIVRCNYQTLFPGCSGNLLEDVAVLLNRCRNRLTDNPVRAAKIEAAVANQTVREFRGGGKSLQCSRTHFVRVWSGVTHDKRNQVNRLVEILQRIPEWLYGLGADRNGIRKWSRVHGHKRRDKGAHLRRSPAQHMLQQEWVAFLRHG